MRYKAVFFDRDGTLTHRNPETQARADAAIRGWGGEPEELCYDEHIGLMERAAEGRDPWYRDVPDEIQFWKRFYSLQLQRFHVREKIQERAEELFQILWLKDKSVYPEVVEVLEYFQSRGYKMGVISDTSPSLQLTLEAVGLAKYFTTFTASSLVGAYKPDPIIFNAALNAQGVSAMESLYVDDYDLEADGARALGFTAFLIDREGKQRGEWAIRSLKEMVAFVESMDVARSNP